MSKIIVANQRKFSFFLYDVMLSWLQIKNQLKDKKADYTIHPYGALGLQQNELSLPLSFSLKNPTLKSLDTFSFPWQMTKRKHPSLSFLPSRLLSFFKKEILSLH